MEFIALAVFLVITGLVLAILSGHPLAWARREWRLMRAPTFAPAEDLFDSAQKLLGPDEARKQKLESRQRALSKRMRKQHRHLFAGKAYTPTLTSPSTPPRPPKADRVRVLKVVGK